ncbi:MAG: autotransporter domain-containing protein, partial [Gammaproteobacteria bacterium]|nr:autotransporter domain-containing protein [Gammaproteobacteria bacterium]
VDSPAFEGVVDPLIEDGVLCQVASVTCVAQTGHIALVTKTELDHESHAQHYVKLGLHDGWERSNAAQDVTIEITVNDLNDPPSAVGRVPNQSLSVQGTETFDASLYFSDEDISDRLLVTATSRDTTIASVSVARAADVSVTGEGIGTARIELTATDTSGSIATQLFDVKVVANRAPVAQSQAFTDRLPENSEMLVGDIVDVSLAGLFVDPDGDAVEVTVESLDDTVLLVSPSSDGSTLTLVARALGTSDLIFTATDSASNVTTEIHTIDVVSQLSATNEPPMLDQAALKEALPENNTMVVGNFHDMMFAGIFSDPEGGSLLVKVSTSDVNVLEVAASDATDTVTLFAISEGSADLTIAATDDGDLTTETVVTIKVIADSSVVDNQAPILDFEAFAAALPPDRSIVLRRFFNMDLTGLFTDPDGDSITLSADSSDTSVLRVSLRQNGTAAFLLARSIGSADLIITASDPEGNETEARATIEVIEESDNRPPTIDREALTNALPTSNSMSEGEFFELQLDTLFSDPDGDDDIVALEGSSSDSDVLDVSVDDTNLLTALALSPGDAVLSLVARDNAGAETKIDETITVTAASAASLAIRTQSFDRSAPLTLELNEFTRDPNILRAIQALRSTVGDDSILSTSLDGSTLTLHALNKGRTFVKLANRSNDEISVRSMFYVDVVNAAPTLVTPLGNQTATRVSGLSIDLHGIFEDADGEAIEITAKSHNEAIASVALDNGTLSIQGLQVGETTMTLIATDVNGAATEVSFKVTIENLAPTVHATVGSIHLQVGGAPHELAFADLFADDGDTLTYTTSLEAADIVRSEPNETGVTLSPLASGNVQMSVTATDPYGGVASFDTEIVVGDERLKEVAAKSLAGFGRALLGSVSSAIDGRATMVRTAGDLTSESWYPISHAEFLHDHPSIGIAHSIASNGGEFNAAWSPNPESIDSNVFAPTSPSSFPLFRNEFSFSLGTIEKSTPWSIWSNTDRYTFGGDAYDGALSNGYLGLDRMFRDEWVVGVALGQHHGNSEYEYGTASQHLDIELKQLMPYASFTPSDKTGVWGTIGVGSGELGTTVVGREDVASELTSHLAVLGARHRVAELSGVDISLRGDVSTVSLATSAGETASDGLSANVHLARTGLEATYAIDCFGDVEVNPFGQLHLPKDGGDGETGSRFEFVGGLRLGYKSVSVEMVGRSFEIHGPQQYSERGLSINATVNPSLDGSGFSASISPRWGAEAFSNGEIWRDFVSSVKNAYPSVSPELLDNERRMQLRTQFGYGFLLRHERFLMTP